MALSLFCSWAATAILSGDELPEFFRPKTTGPALYRKQTHGIPLPLRSAQHGPNVVRRRYLQFLGLFFSRKRAFPLTYGLSDVTGHQILHTKLGEPFHARSKFLGLFAMVSLSRDSCGSFLYTKVQGS